MRKGALIIYCYELNVHAVQPLMDFEGRKIAGIRGAYQHQQRRREMEEGQEETVAESKRRQEEAPAPPTANTNFPGPDPFPNSNK
jgi:hypothetical protein